MFIFEFVKTAKSRKFNKWHLIWILFVLNIIGFATARFYFQDQDEHLKADTEAVDFKNKYGASVHHANTLVSWSLELLHLLRGRN